MPSIADPLPLAPVYKAWDQPDTVTLAVGPEGGLAPAEQNRLVAEGAQLARLGPRGLRAANAGAFAAFWLTATRGTMVAASLSGAG